MNGISETQKESFRVSFDMKRNENIYLSLGSGENRVSLGMSNNNE